MLTRCVKAVAVRKLSVYIQPFHHSSFLQCALHAAEDRKNQ